MAEKSRQIVYDRQAEILKALAHPVRIAILDFLRKGEKCVCHIAEHVGSEQSNVSKHLSVMVKAGVLDSRKQGLNVMYELKTPCILGFFSCLEKCIKVQAEDNRKLLNAL